MKIAEILHETTGPLVPPQFVNQVMRQDTGQYLPLDEIIAEIDRRVQAGEITLPPKQYSDDAAKKILDQYLVKAFQSGKPENFFSSPQRAIKIVDQILYNCENGAWSSRIFWNWYRKNQQAYEAAYFRLAGNKPANSAGIADAGAENEGDWRSPEAVDPETGHLYPEYEDQMAKNVAKKINKNKGR